MSWHRGPTVSEFGGMTKNILLKNSSYICKMSRCFGYPSIDAIESTNCCNLSCIMCPVNTGKMVREQGFMSFQLFRKIIDENKRFIIENKFSTKPVWLHNFGEPLLHPNMFDMISYCKENGILCGISTNAVLLNLGVAKKILESGLDEIIFSFDGAIKDTYEKVRVGADFDAVKENIINFLHMRREMRTRKPYVSIRILRMTETEEEIGKFYKMWQDYNVDNIMVRNIHTWAGQLKEVDRFSSLKCSRRAGARSPCAFLWYHLVILWDGTVVPCCFDYNGELPLGNVKDSTLAEIWNSEKTVNARKLHVSGNYSRILLCKGCEEWPDKASHLLWQVKRSYLGLRSVLVKGS